MINGSGEHGAAQTRFGTRIGGLLAAAGSAVGLGNVWRFPTEAGSGGGAAFLLIYIAAMLLLGVPVMIGELAIGRHGGKNVSHSFFAMSGGRRAWGWMGIVPVVAGVLILSYYAVVAGWTLDYFVRAAAGGFALSANISAGGYAASFAAFSSSFWKPVVCLAAMLFLTAAIVAFGVKRGIERASKIMMPLLFVCLALLAVCSLTLDGATDGVRFFLHPDFSKITGGVALSAMAQAFFSLSVGIYCLCTYGCYFRKDVDLVRESLSVAGIDTLVAVMAGLVIFPAVFSAGIAPDAGPTLVFITLPEVFQRAFGGAPVFAYFFSLAFYLLLVVAALTSMISMLETAAAIFIRKYKIARPAACFAMAALCTLLGIACSLSFGAWGGVRVAGMGVFDLFDFLVAKVIMPLCAIVTCLFLGWVVEKNVLRDELTNGGTLRQPLFGFYRLLVRYIAPAGIAIIFLNGMGLF
ncbi:MAG: sodium-dependent transporter [Prevotella sp.]|nr:sodium-dependent transporter [Prevotella sp.]